MNVVTAKQLSGPQGERELDALRARILSVYERGDLTADTVIAACNALSEKLEKHTHLPLLLAAGIPAYRAADELAMAKRMLSADYLRARLDRELGAPPGEFVPFGETAPVRWQWRPLGTLFHITAGNADALPAFSAIEGLLTGNVNILKLPEGDGGLSALILSELIELCPQLSDYLVLFDCPSREIEAMRRMAELADAIVLWGGDEAVRAVRALAGPDTRVIEWGRRISFAYVSGTPSDEALSGVAANICDTNQLLCNSCQGVYVDTGDFACAEAFAERFSAILERTAKAAPYDPGMRLTAQKTLMLYTERLESRDGQKRVMEQENSSVIAYSDRRLTASYQFRSCWVRPLPERELLRTLVPYKNRLQTAALLCPPDARPRLEALLSRTGIVRITDGAHMSKPYCGLPHDGESALRRYQKLVSYEYRR